MPNASRFRVLVPVALAACLSVAAPPPGAARDDTPPEIAERSNPVTLGEAEVDYFQRQYKARCARCHGIEGNGRGKDAGQENVPPRDFTDADYMKSRTDGQLYWQIFAGGGERCSMPAFGPTSDAGWSEEKIWGMVAFVRRFAAPAD